MHSPGILIGSLFVLTKNMRRGSLEKKLTGCSLYLNSSKAVGGLLFKNPNLDILYPTDCRPYRYSNANTCTNSTTEH